MERLPRRLRQAIFWLLLGAAVVAVERAVPYVLQKADPAIWTRLNQLEGDAHQAVTNFEPFRLMELLDEDARIGAQREDEPRLQACIADPKTEDSDSYVECKKWCGLASYPTLDAPRLNPHALDPQVSGQKQARVADPQSLDECLRGCPEKACRQNDPAWKHSHSPIESIGWIVFAEIDGLRWFFAIELGKQSTAAFFVLIGQLVLGFVLTYHLMRWCGLFRWPILWIPLLVPCVFVLGSVSAVPLKWAMDFAVDSLGNLAGLDVQSGAYSIGTFGVVDLIVSKATDLRFHTLIEERLSRLIMPWLKL
ncbi:MAG: hypothetical protein JO267_08510 [Alphaproteobacteria bacterium]|nr:hypothetical protein [Alphaproteobacteria bacterium]